MIKIAIMTCVKSLFTVYNNNKVYCKIDAEMIIFIIIYDVVVEYRIDVCVMWDHENIFAK